jgi:hypothetical protein
MPLRIIQRPFKTVSQAVFDDLSTRRRIWIGHLSNPSSKVILQQDDRLCRVHDWLKTLQPRKPAPARPAAGPGPIGGKPESRSAASSGEADLMRPCRRPLEGLQQAIQSLPMGFETALRRAYKRRLQVFKKFLIWPLNHFYGDLIKSS